jgi:hypothetical protein
VLAARRAPCSLSLTLSLSLSLSVRVARWRARAREEELPKTSGEQSRETPASNPARVGIDRWRPGLRGGGGRMGRWREPQRRKLVLSPLAPPPPPPRIASANVPSCKKSGSSSHAQFFATHILQLNSSLSLARARRGKEELGGGGAGANRGNAKSTMARTPVAARNLGGASCVSFCSPSLHLVFSPSPPFPFPLLSSNT